LRQNNNVTVHQCSPEYITEKSLYNNMWAIFMSYVLAVRDRVGLKNEKVVLLTDVELPHTGRPMNP
jgi:hypothetical protein